MKPQAKPSGNDSRRDVLTREAELRALRAQVDPHFLDNSLNSISVSTASYPAGARRMCILLADFLRNTLSVSAHESIRLADELALADRFPDIEQVRVGSRLKVERRVDVSAVDCLVPPLILQPLVENAVTHGIAGMLDGGLILLTSHASLGISRSRSKTLVTATRELPTGSGLVWKTCAGASPSCSGILPGSARRARRNDFVSSSSCRGRLDRP